MDEIAALSLFVSSVYTCRYMKKSLEEKSHDGSLHLFFWKTPRQKMKVPFSYDLPKEKRVTNLQYLFHYERMNWI